MPRRKTPSIGKNAADFVLIRNGRFELRGRPHFFVGTNLWYGCYLSDARLSNGRKRMIRELDRLKDIGVTNIRLLAGSETSPLAGAIPRGITRAPGDYDKDLLAGLDFCLAEMAKRDMRGILFVSNYWQWSGGFAQYVRWITNETIPDPDKPVQAEGDWTGFIKFSARLYTMPAANQLYLDYISHLIRRRNTVNGRIYRDDPAIMTWELANEPRPGADDQTADVPLFSRWVDATARFIHARDPNHLVCTGSEGIHGCLDNPDHFVQSHQSAAIDYVTVHMWLKNWRWLADPRLGAAYEKAADRARDHVEQHTVLAGDTLRKPLVLEEFGLPRDHEKYEPGAPATARDDYFGRMFNQVAESCKAGRALQGANFWAWGGEGRAGGGNLHSAGALMGDPFSEPQGLNSIFDTDKSTLSVIARANKKLAALAGQAASSFEFPINSTTNRPSPMNKISFQSKLKQLQRQHEQLIKRRNRPRKSGNGIFDRYEFPVLTAEHTPLFWRYDFNQADNPHLMTRLGINCAFNVGAMDWNGHVVLMARVEGWDRKSFFAVAESSNGVDGFRFWDYPVRMPELEDKETNLYDMRLVRHQDGWIYGLFCAERHDDSKPGDLSAAVARCGIARTKDLVQWERLPDLKTSSLHQRNCVLHPEFVNGKYAFYTRPMTDFAATGSGDGIGWGLCDDITHPAIGAEQIIDPRFYHTIKEGKNGLGPAPIKTKKGWLHLAHGVRNTAAAMRYVLYMFLCDLSDPAKIIKAPGGYFMAPEGEERVGDVSNVVFSNGWVARPNGDVFIYYGSSDTRTHVAASTVDKLLDYVQNTPADGMRTKICVEQRCRLIGKNLRLSAKKK